MTCTPKAQIGILEVRFVEEQPCDQGRNCRCKHVCLRQVCALLAQCSCSANDNATKGYKYNEIN